ncbi:HNH endonuclease, partial [Escherichia coli]
PQSWYSCWPLENGHMVTNSDATVMNQIVLSGTDLTPEQLLVRKRQQAIATLGNLTLLNLSVNRSVQNAVFLKKRDALIVHTNLRLNIPLILKDKWDESEIQERGKKLGEIALKVWPKYD